jgi:hypothetical protein
MSELNDLIASSTIHAYNSGIEQGRHLERDRIVEILQEHAPMVWRGGIIELIKGEK